MDHSINTNDLIRIFESYFPTIAKHVKEYAEYDYLFPYELTFYLANNTTWVFDAEEKFIRKIAKDSSNLTEDEYRALVGYRLNKYMLTHGWTQETLSEASGVSQAALSNYISGQHTMTLYRARRIVKTLRCSPDLLIF